MKNFVFTALIISLFANQTFAKDFVSEYCLENESSNYVACIQREREWSIIAAYTNIIAKEAKVDHEDIVECTRQSLDKSRILLANCIKDLVIKKCH